MSEVGRVPLQLLQRALQAVKEGRARTDVELARTLGVRLEEARLIVTALRGSGLLREVSASCTFSCENCPIKSSCTIREQRLRLYAVADEKAL
uniref:Transcriptional regulator HTH-type FeoC domain-containing protein n=1 Tax=Thermofilum pendens TaxID=2269 RepID=A0A7C4FF41_THEPE